VVRWVHEGRYQTYLDFNSWTAGVYVVTLGTFRYGPVVAHKCCVHVFSTTLLVEQGWSQFISFWPPIAHLQVDSFTWSESVSRVLYVCGPTPRKGYLSKGLGSAVLKDRVWHTFMKFHWNFPFMLKIVSSLMHYYPCGDDNMVLILLMSTMYTRMWSQE
jgi:hypothetical protein